MHCLTALALLALLTAAGCSMTDTPADAASPMAPAGGRPTLSVLWIGNSYTADCRVPDIVAGMMEEAPSPVRMKPDVGCVGGKDWKFHWEDPGSKGLPLLKENDYDLVVLQNHSLGGVFGRDDMMDYGRRFCELIRERGAEPVLYCTWPRRTDKAQTGSVESDWEKIRTAYEQVAAENDALLVPVGHAWLLAMKERPKIELYAPDGSHPSKLGAYLTACVFYAALTGRSPVGLVWRTSWQVEFPNERWTRVEYQLDDETAGFLQQIAWRTWQAHGAAGPPA
jgi:hypothetical protein